MFCPSFVHIVPILLRLGQSDRDKMFCPYFVLRSKLDKNFVLFLSNLALVQQERFIAT
jgi:hypothetical protein